MMSLQIGAEPLQIVCVPDPVLHTEARELSLEEIRSPEMSRLIEAMKKCMQVSGGIGLAAPQIGKSLQVIVYEDMDQSFLTPDQIRERKRYPVPFHVLINPRIIEQSGATTIFYEGCLSVPNYRAKVPRIERVRVQYLNERGFSVVIDAEGWYARGLQHEIDHLRGELYTDCMVKGTGVTDEEYETIRLANTQPHQ